MKEIFVNRTNEFVEIAITQEKKLVRYYMDGNDLSPKIGDVYKGTVKKVVPALKGAFVDIGYDKNAFLYIDRKNTNTQINQQDDIVVQVLKEEIGNKGAKVTNNISIPGKYSVLLQDDTGVLFSKKINDEAFKDSIKNLIPQFNDLGIMLRTESQNVLPEQIVEEIYDLKNTYDEIVKKSKFYKAPIMLYKTRGILYRILIDIVDNNTSKIVLNSLEDYTEVNNFIKSKVNDKVEVSLYSDEIPLLQAFSLTKAVDEIHDRKVFLPCGGYLIIEKTEAMHVIDVNSGKNVKACNISKTIFETNIEAAKEIGRQVILRNLGGIIVIDFIDMNKESEKHKVIEVLNKSFETDKNKTIIYPFTELNLVQIARRRGEV